MIKNFRLRIRVFIRLKCKNTLKIKFKSRRVKSKSQVRRCQVQVQVHRSQVQVQVQVHRSQIQVQVWVHRSQVQVPKNGTRVQVLDSSTTFLPDHHQPSAYQARKLCYSNMWKGRELAAHNTSAWSTIKDFDNKFIILHFVDENKLFSEMPKFVTDNPNNIPSKFAK